MPDGLEHTLARNDLELDAAATRRDADWWEKQGRADVGKQLRQAARCLQEAHALAEQEPQDA